MLNIYKMCLIHITNLTIFHLFRAKSSSKNNKPDSSKRIITEIYTDIIINRIYLVVAQRNYDNNFLYQKLSKPELELSGYCTEPFEFPSIKFSSMN